MVSFENFVKSMISCLSELKVPGWSLVNPWPCEEQLNFSRHTNNPWDHEFIEIWKLKFYWTRFPIHVTLPLVKIRYLSWMTMEILLLNLNLTVEKRNPQITPLRQVSPECISNQMERKGEKDLKSNTPVKKQRKVGLRLGLHTVTRLRLWRFSLYSWHKLHFYKKIKRCKMFYWYL